jgi:nitrogen fixation/metabolism regulation signal transduction histidine kinase
MRPVSVPGLYFLRQSVDAMYYLGKIKIPQSDERTSYQSNIFIEISSNDTWKGLGYPELLIDRKNINAENFNNYSYAFYSKGELIKNVGKYSYDIENQYIKKIVTKDGFYTSKGYSHYVFVGDANTMIVLSKEVPRISDLISPFSYIFILLMIMLLIVNGIMGFANSWKAGIHTFRLRLQLIMIAVIVVSSILLVTVSLLFINMLNRNKNNEILSEKLNSVLIDLETRYGNSSSFDDLSSNELTDLLINLSNTYFTDINLYNANGFLLASSRDQIFKEGMISEQMSPSSARQLMVEKKSIFIENENIGNYSFLSAYTPLRNIDNKLLGYLNLPYFAKQEEIRKEISSLISAFANIYIIMIVITVLLALLLSRYITKPLQHIGNQFSMVKIGDKNAKISWYRKDEIGRLVDEYNRMIDEMERSTELLARSERESAWRQMARQVAHEIKNPLTPIKLSMQLLMRAWNDKAPDWDIRLKRFSQTLIMQIDTLSSIATEFSDFAQMPEPQIQAFDVIPIIQQSAALFRDQSDCEIFFNCDYEDCIIISDQNQILRVFNNLIKNALQAIPGDRKGRIQITLSKTDSVCEISFQDNGTGIPTERQTRIFSPNFTTKTAGMGLGLAMVKNIIDNSSGQIWFETDPGEGTTFYVSLPLKHQEASK